jgi:hypothetical protein
LEWRANLLQDCHFNHLCLILKSRLPNLAGLLTTLSAIILVERQQIWQLLAENGHSLVAEIRHQANNKPRQTAVTPVIQVTYQCITLGTIIALKQ